MWDNMNRYPFPIVQDVYSQAPVQSQYQQLVNPLMYSQECQQDLASVENPTQCPPQNMVFYSYYFQQVADYTLLQLQKENMQLKNQLDKKVLQEEAWKELIEVQGNAYFSFTESGRAVQLTHFVFESVKVIQYDLFYARKPQLLVKLSIQEKPGMINLDDIFNDRKWIAFLEQTSQTSIKLYKSAKHIAILLRSIAYRCAAEVFVPYFGGWVNTDDHQLYYTFPGFWTSAGSDTPESYECVYAEIPYSARAAAEKYLSRMEPVLDKPLRNFFIIWMHTSFLQSLLSHLGVQISKIPVIQAANPVVQTYLHRILSVHHSRILNMNMPPDDFAHTLADYKDQPLVIRYQQCGKNSADNEEILGQALSGGRIPIIKNKKEMGQLAFGTLPILLSDSTADLSRKFYGIPITATADAFDLTQCAAVMGESICAADYWSAFLAFTSKRIDKLNRLIQTFMPMALQLSSDKEYTAEHAIVLGAMCGVAVFLEQFYQELSISGVKILNNGWMNYMIELLEESSAQFAAPEGLADSFIAAAKQAILKNRFPCYQIFRTLSAIPRGAIYYSDTYVCFDRIAFETICQSAACNPGAVKRDLAEQGYFFGKMVNSHSYESRISLDLQKDAKRTIRVYKFKRELIESLGEPALFQER